MHCHSRLDLVVPISMEVCLNKVYFSNFRISNLDSFFVDVLIEHRSYLKTLRRSGVRDELHDRLSRDRVPSVSVRRP